MAGSRPTPPVATAAAASVMPPIAMPTAPPSAISLPACEPGISARGTPWANCSWHFSGQITASSSLEKPAARRSRTARSAWATLSKKPTRWGFSLAVSAMACSLFRANIVIAPTSGRSKLHARLSPGSAWWGLAVQQAVLA